MKNRLKIQPIREAFMLLALICLGIGWGYAVKGWEALSETAMWTALVLAIGSEAYAKDEKA